MTKTQKTTAFWLLVVALLVANHQDFASSQLTPQTSTSQAQTTQQLPQQQPQQQPPNLVQGTVNAMTSGLPSSNNNPVPPLSPQQQQQQQQQQPLRVQANVVPQQVQPPQASGQFTAQSPDGQLPLNIPQNGLPVMTSNGQQQQLPTANYQQQLPTANYQQQLPTANYQQQQQQVPPQAQHQNYPAAMMPIRQNYIPQQVDHVQQQQWRPQTVNPSTMMQQPQHLQQQQPQQQPQQQLPVQGQQYAQQYPQMPPKPMQVTMPVPQQQQQQYPVQSYGGVQNYQNPNVPQYQTTAGINPNQGYTTGTGQLQRQPSSGSPLTAAFTMLDPTPLGKQALDMTSATMSSALNLGNSIKDGVGGATVDFAHKIVDIPDAMMKGAFSLATALPGAISGLKHKSIDTVANMLSLPNSRRQQREQLQQQQQQLDQQREQLQQLQQQQQQGYMQQSNNGPPQYGYQQTSSTQGGRNVQGPIPGGLNPVNGPQPIVRYGANMGIGT